MKIVAVMPSPLNPLKDRDNGFQIVKLGINSWIILLAVLLIFTSVCLMLDVVRRNGNWNSYLRSIKIDETERIALERDLIGPSLAVIGHLILTYIHMHHFALSRCYYWVNVSQRRMFVVSLLSVMYFVPFLSMLSLQWQLTNWSILVPSAARFATKYSCEGFHSYAIQMNCPNIADEIASVMGLTVPVFVIHVGVIAVFIFSQFCCPKKAPPLDFPRPPFTAKSLTLMKALNVEENTMEWQVFYGQGAKVDMPTSSVLLTPVPGSSKVVITGKEKPPEPEIRPKRSTVRPRESRMA